MFYCAPCAIINDWPQPLFGGSYGKCETCGKTAPCFDVHHSQLPEKKKQEAKDGRS